MSFLNSTFTVSIRVRRNSMTDVVPAYKVAQTLQRSLETNFGWLDVSTKVNDGYQATMPQDYAADLVALVPIQVKNTKTVKPSVPRNVIVKAS